MAGQVRKLIDAIIEERAGSDETLVAMTRIRMRLKGIDCDKWGQASDDDPQVIATLQEMRNEFRTSRQRGA